MKYVNVFCGSSRNADQQLIDISVELGKRLARNNFGLVYGGASIGLMGALADAVLEEQGTVYGVIPQKMMSREIAHSKLTDLHVVGTMHERKQKMYNLSDAFVAIPGGFGTLDEFCEILTWKQIEEHNKPIALFNYDGFFGHFIEQVEVMVKKGIVSEDHKSLFEVCNDLDAVFTFLMRDDISC